jgi:hypothetical protein
MPYCKRGRRAERKEERRERDERRTSGVCDVMLDGE